VGILALVALMSAAANTDAHPHVWIETVATFVFDRGKVVAAIAAGMAVTMSVLNILGILARWAVLSRLEAAGQRHSSMALVLEYAGALIILTVSSVLFVGVL
jgi:ABC-type nickel/cobalt efflux system permease component RcnA